VTIFNGNVEAIQQREIMKFAAANGETVHIMSDMEKSSSSVL
jgi:hypothetical protein